MSRTSLHRLRAYVFLAPFLALFAVFNLYPLLRSLMLSFYRSAGPARQDYIGLANYRFLLRDWLFWRAALNTVAFSIAFVLLYVPLSLGLALLLNNRRVRGRNIFRFAFFSSHLVGNVFAAIMFSLLLSPHRGLVNRIIHLVFPTINPDWRNDMRFALPAILIAAIWLSIGYAMIYFLAALQNVDPQLIEAARVDGAGSLSRFRHITFPGIAPMIGLVALIGTIASLQMFELPYVFFNGPGPGFAGLTIVMYLYQQGFEVGNIGYAAAIGWVLTVLLVIVSLLQLKLVAMGRRR